MKLTTDMDVARHFLLEGLLILGNWLWSNNFFFTFTFWYYTLCTTHLRLRSAWLWSLESLPSPATYLALLTLASRQWCCEILILWPLKWVNPLIPNCRFIHGREREKERKKFLTNFKPLARQNIRRPWHSVVATCKNRHLSIRKNENKNSIQIV